MNRTEPPRIASWMLGHLMPERGNEALTGDLLESYRNGRSRGWYWWQVTAALAVAWIHCADRRRMALAFAGAWCMWSPAWDLILRRLQNDTNFAGFVWTLPWPWSTICAFGFWTLMRLLFVWAGVLIYVLFLIITLRAVKARISRGFALSIAGFIAIHASMFAFTLTAAPQVSAHFVNWRTFTLQSVVADFGMRTMPMRLAYLVGTVCAIWGVAPIKERVLKPVE